MNLMAHTYIRQTREKEDFLLGYNSIKRMVDWWSSNLISFFDSVFRVYFMKRRWLGGFARPVDPGPGIFQPFSSS